MRKMLFGSMFWREGESACDDYSMKENLDVFFLSLPVLSWTGMVDCYGVANSDVYVYFFLRKFEGGGCGMVKELGEDGYEGWL
jgi:hypothetical protein